MYTPSNDNATLLVGLFFNIELGHSFKIPVPTCCEDPEPIGDREGERVAKRVGTREGEGEGKPYHDE